MHTRSTRSLASARGVSGRTLSASVARSEKATGSMVSFFASSFEKSRISSMRRSSISAEPRTVAT